MVMVWNNIGVAVILCVCTLGHVYSQEFENLQEGIGLLQDLDLRENGPRYERVKPSRARLPSFNLPSMPSALRFRALSDSQLPSLVGGDIGGAQHAELRNAARQQLHQVRFSQVYAKNAGETIETCTSKPDEASKTACFTAVQARCANAADREACMKTPGTAAPSEAPAAAPAAAPADSASETIETCTSKPDEASKTACFTAVQARCASATDREACMKTPGTTAPSEAPAAAAAAPAGSESETIETCSSKKDEAAKTACFAAVQARCASATDREACMKTPGTAAPSEAPAEAPAAAEAPAGSESETIETCSSKKDEAAKTACFAAVQARCASATDREACMKTPGTAAPSEAPAGATEAPASSHPPASGGSLQDAASIAAVLDMDQQIIQEVINESSGGGGGAGAGAAAPAAAEATAPGGTATPDLEASPEAISEDVAAAAAILDGATEAPAPATKAPAAATEAPAAATPAPATTTAPVQATQAPATSPAPKADSDGMPPGDDGMPPEEKAPSEPAHPPAAEPKDDMPPGDGGSDDGAMPPGG